MGRLCAAILIIFGVSPAFGGQERCLPGKNHSMAESRAECRQEKKPEKRAEKKAPVSKKLEPREEISVSKAPKDAPSEGVDDYLCEVYSRLPLKVDSAGDFTWKDPAAAAKLGMSTCQYAIQGMDPDFREGLAAMGHEADKKEIKWSFLSGYRDEYRQRIAVGYKAGPCASWHSNRTCGSKGYGQGRAADLWVADQHGKNADPNPLFQLVDAIGKALGIHRPMPGRDEAHVQTTWDFRKRAASLRLNYAKVAAQKVSGVGGNNASKMAGSRGGS